MEIGPLLFNPNGINIVFRYIIYSPGDYKMGSECDDIKILSAKLLIHEIKSHGLYDHIHDTEFKVFSQWGDDGIIQYLIHTIDITNHTFIEFGVDDYKESNTRFLLMNNNWKGFVLDPSEENILSIQKDEVYWKFDLTAVKAFIDRENINELIEENGFCKEIGLLSIDIDGNDYWIWECIDVINPIIVIIEYNSHFGIHHAFTVPYDPIFNRTETHYSNLFFGCSLKALVLLSEKKGYAFVGSNSNGNNAYFVRNDKLGKIRALTLEEGYVESRFRESLDMEGNLSYLSGSQRLEIIKNMIVYDLESEALVSLRDLYP